MTLTYRQFWAAILSGAALCFALGVAAFALFAALVIAPMREAEMAQQIESAYIRGSMAKIDATRKKFEQCRQVSGGWKCE